jgi:hypothetical protein
MAEKSAPVAIPPADVTFYEALNARLAPAVVKVALLLQQAAYHGRRAPEDLPAEPYPLYKAQAVALLDDPNLLGAIYATLTLHRAQADEIPAPPLPDEVEAQEAANFASFDAFKAAADLAHLAPGQGDQGYPDESDEDAEAQRNAEIDYRGHSDIAAHGDRVVGFSGETPIRQSQVGLYGDLDFPAPNHFDPSKRGFSPK